MTRVTTNSDLAEARSRREPIIIGSWTLHADLGVLRRGGEEQRLNAKALHVLLVLVDANGMAVSREQILDTVWGSSYPTDAVVSRAIADLRSAMGESAGDQASIRTVPKFGYQLVAVDGDSPTAAKASPWVYAVLPVLLILILWWAWPPSDAPESIALQRLPAATPLTADPGLEHQPRAVPGSDWIVYAALRPEQGDWDLFRVSTSNGASQAIAATNGVVEHGPAVSPDGEQIAYVRMSSAGCEVVRQSMNLGVPRTLANCTMKFPTLVDWSPDGNKIAYTGHEQDDVTGRRRLYEIRLDNNGKSPLSHDVSQTGSDFYPRYSPSGRHVAFLRGEPQPDHRSSLWVVDTHDGRETRLTAQPAQLGGMSWINESSLLYTIMDAGRLETRTVSLSDAAQRRIDGPDLVHPEIIAEHNQLVAAILRSERDLALVDKEGSVTAVASSTSDDHHGVLQPQGGFVAYISRRSGFDEIWIYDIAASTARQITSFGGATVRYPAWHPGGLQLLFSAEGDAGERIYEVDILSSAIRPVSNQDVEATTPVWMPDASAKVFGCESSGEWGICVADEVQQRTIATGFFRPIPIDQRWLAVVDLAGSLYRMRIDDGHTELIRSNMAGAGRFGWTLNGDQLFYIRPIAGGSEAQVIRHDLGSGAESVAYSGKMPLADTTLSYNEATQQLLVTRFQTASDDLVLIDLENFSFGP